MIGCPEVKPQSELAFQKFSQRDVCQGQVFCHHWHIKMMLSAGWCCKYLLPCLIPHLVGTHSLTKELVGDPLDSDVHFGYFRIVEALRVASKGLLCGNILEEHQDALHAAGGHVKINVPEDVALVSADFTVLQYPVIRIARRPPYSGCVTISYSRLMFSMSYEASVSPVARITRL